MVVNSDLGWLSQVAKISPPKKTPQVRSSGLETQNRCAELKLHCERKAGRLLAELHLGRGRLGKKKWSHDGTILKDLGINKNQSSRWQMEAEVPDSLFRLYLKVARQEQREVTAKDSCGWHNTTVLPLDIGRSMRPQ